MNSKSMLLAAASAATLLSVAVSAQASTVFDTSLTDPPGVFFGLGNFNTHFAVTTADGIEIGLKSKIRGDANDTTTPVGDLYSIALGNKVSFDYAVIPGATDLTGVTFALNILNVGTGQTFSFNPATVGDNTTMGTAFENSEQIAFFPVGFGLNTNATYNITLSLGNVGANHDTISVENVVKFGTGAAVPEPASWALMILGFGGVGAGLRRARKAEGAATA